MARPNYGWIISHLNDDFVWPLRGHPGVGATVTDASTHSTQTLFCTLMVVANLTKSCTQVQKTLKSEQTVWFETHLTLIYVHLEVSQWIIKVNEKSLHLQWLTKQECLCIFPLLQTLAKWQILWLTPHRVSGQHANTNPTTRGINTHLLWQHRAPGTHARHEGTRTARWRHPRLRAPINTPPV